MKHCKPILLASLLVTLGGGSLALGQGTAFTYQGQLADNGTAAQGSYDLRFRLYDDAAAGSQLGDVTVAPVAVSNGLFTVTLDFGAGIFTGPPRWLEISVRTNGSVADHTLLTPRQSLTAAPYALYALNAANAAAAASLPWSGLTGLPLGFDDGFDNDTLYAAGAGLTLAGTNFALDTAFTDGRYWKLTGNAGTTPGVNFLGTTDNQALELKVNNVRALRLEPNVSSPNVIGGHSANVANSGAYGATIGGGGSAGNINRISAHFGTIGGGVGNTIQTNAYDSTIGGGANNTIQTNVSYATLGGGWRNMIQTDAGYATVGGGHHNLIRTDASVATIGGGANNTIRANARNSTIGGGGPNTIQDDASDATIGGGNHNTIQTWAYDSTVGGGYWNTIQAEAYDSTIGGGSYNNIGTNAFSSAIGGGDNNNIADNSPGATIAGGRANDIAINAFCSMIGGGTNNYIGTNSDTSAISGGENNNIGTNCHSSTIGGGRYNWIANYSYSPTIAGGAGNNIARVCDQSAIGGGLANKINDLSHGATIGGGYSNNIATLSEYATIPGGIYNTATNYAFAAGRRAKARHTGAFVWADSSAFDFPSTANNQFNVRATGGVRIVTGIDGAGAPDAGVSLNADDSSWNVISDRNAKKNFRPVNVREVMERLAQVPVQRWNYKWEPDGAVPHLGPMAQDFKAAFFPGRDDKTISTLEADGVALAAIQGLNQKLEEKNAALERGVAELKALVKTLAEKVNGGGQ